MTEVIQFSGVPEESSLKDLLIVSAAPAAQLDGRLFLDAKFAEGISFYASRWPGKVFCLLTKKRQRAFEFGKFFEHNDLNFEVIFQDSRDFLNLSELKNLSTALLSADSPTSLKLVERFQKSQIRFYLTIEYTIETRLRIIMLDHKAAILRKIYSAAWNLILERKRRQAIRSAHGLQANGYPAFLAYRALNSNTVTYLDGRVWPHMLASDTDMKNRLARLSSTRPLNIIHSGRLESLKGSQDVIKIASILNSRGVNFEIQIFGHGSIEEQMKNEANRLGLNERVFFHGAVDFEANLLPYCRSHGDIYLSCHRQSDPSCTYLESMGAGMAVFGYENMMLKHLLLDSSGGWAVQDVGDFEALADLIAEKTANKVDIFAGCERALEFSRNHTFDKEFEKRVAHLNS